jgi:predicted extracellular nuclease
MRHYLILIFATFAGCGGSGATTNGSPPPNSPSTTAIYSVQGNGASSPLNGQSVIVEGVVTGDFQDGDSDASQNLGGFYIQSVPDADLESSDGVFIFDGSNPTVDVDAGDLVQVEGLVNEFFGETQIKATSVAVMGNGAIQAVPVNLPSAATTTNSDGQLLADLERYEGMLVRFPQTLTVSQLRNLERYGEVLLSVDGRQYGFTNRNAPDVAAYAAHVEAIAVRRVLLDDGLRTQNAAVIRYLHAGAAANYSIRNGDEITNLTGVLRYSRGSGGSGTEAYRLMPTIDPQFDSVNPRPGVPAVSGAIRVASFNLNNFFSTVDTGQSICGPAGNANCRGADSTEELSRQLDRIVTTLELIDADVVGLVELENNASSSLQSIVDALNASVGTGTYAYVDTGTIGDDAIKVGLLFKPATMQPTGLFAVLDSSVDARFDDSRSRPVLAQTFQSISSGGRLTVIVNHLKSKGSSCDSSGDPNLGDGQSNCSATRNAAAAAMVDWLATDPTSSGDADFLIIGDPNGHTFDDAITTFRNGGYSDLAEAFIGANSYSFEFDGQFGALDHALASASLVPQVSDAVEWHINGDEPRVLDYNLEFDRNPGLFDANSPYRTSDHDPLIIGIDLIP